MKKRLNTINNIFAAIFCIATIIAIYIGYGKIKINNYLAITIIVGYLCLGVIWLLYSTFIVLYKVLDSQKF